MNDPTGYESCPMCGAYLFDGCDCRPIGDCHWCSKPVWEDDDYVTGNRGEGVMHSDCDDDAYWDSRAHTTESNY